MTGWPCRCTRHAGACRQVGVRRFIWPHGSLSFLRLVRLLLLLVSELKRWNSVCSSRSSHRSRWRLPWMKRRKRSSLLFCPARMYFSVGPPTVLSLWSCGCCAGSWLPLMMGYLLKKLPQRVPTGLAATIIGERTLRIFFSVACAHRSSTFLARQVPANGKPSEWIRKTRMLLVDEVSTLSPSFLRNWASLHVLTVGRCAVRWHASCVHR